MNTELLSRELQKPQMMRNLLIDKNLDAEFWQEYALLWENSIEKSPFQAPAILISFYGKTNNEVIALRLERNHELIGAVILEKNHGVYSFLSDFKTDANFFVFRSCCNEEDFSFFFQKFLEIISRQGWKVMLNNVPSWACYLQVFEQCGEQSNLFFRSMNYSVSPIYQSSSPEDLLNTLNRTQRARVKANKFRDRLHADFEVMTNGEDLANWVDEFCSAHKLRWASTNTPSMYLKPGRQEFLLKCVQAWSEDGVLVRFAIKINNRRIGFIIGLVSGRSVISHTLTYHPDFQKISPTVALLPTVADWMVGNGLDTLDFGDGNEAYKYRVANQDPVLKRIFISTKNNYSFIGKVKLIGLVRNHAGFYGFYQRNIKKYLNGHQYAKVEAGHSGE